MAMMMPNFHGHRTISDGFEFMRVAIGLGRTLVMIIGLYRLGAVRMTLDHEHGHDKAMGLVVASE